MVPILERKKPLGLIDVNPILQRLVDTCEKLVRAHDSKQGIFRWDSSVPETIIPEGVKADTKEHALFLFYTIALDSMRPSERVYRAGRCLARDFDLEDLASMPLWEIRGIMDSVLDNGIGEPARIIYEGSRLLESKYDGDPRNKTVV